MAASVAIGRLCSDLSDGTVCCDWSALLWLVRWPSLLRLKIFIFWVNCPFKVLWRCSVCEFYDKLCLVLKCNAGFQKNNTCVRCLSLLCTYVGVCECESPGRLCVSPLVLFGRRITFCGRRAFLPRRHSWPVLETTLSSHTYLCVLFVHSSPTVWLRLLKWAGFVWMRHLVSVWLP